MPEETTAVATTTKKSIQLTETGGLALTSIADMYRFAECVALANLAPKGMEKPEQLVVALELGYELGLKPMQAIQNIAVINGRPAIWGDALPAIVRSSRLMKSYEEREVGTKWNDDYGYEVTSVRRGTNDGDKESCITTLFNIGMAKQAGLWKKAGPWTFYPERMLKMRARAFNLRDNFPDVMKGMITVEEAQDIEYEVISTKPLSRTEQLANIIGDGDNGSGDSTPQENVDAARHVVDAKISEPAIPKEQAKPEPAKLDLELINYGSYVKLSKKDYDALVTAFKNPATDEAIDALNVYLYKHEDKREGNHYEMLTRNMKKKEAALTSDQSKLL